MFRRTVIATISTAIFCLTAAGLPANAAPNRPPAKPTPVKQTTEELAAKANKDPLTAQGTANLKILNNNQGKLKFTFRYSGAQDKPFYKVSLNAGDIRPAGEMAFTYDEKITAEDSANIIKILASSIWINKATDTLKALKIAQPDGYLLEITGYDADRLMIGPIGFDSKTYQQLAAIRAVLSGKAASAMDTLLTRIKFLKP
jgi:hypothetical protein